MSSCSYETYRQTLETPAEYCENDVVEGEEFCEQHLYTYEDYLEDRAEYLKEQRLERGWDE